MSINQNVIERFLNDNYSKEDKRAIFQWLLQNEEEANALLSNQWESIDTSETLVSTNLEVIKTRIREAIAEEKEISLVNQKVSKQVLSSKSRSVVWPTWLRYAAAAIIVVVSGLFYLLHEEQQDIVAKQEWVVKENPRGMKSQIQLPDGSKVWLNSASSITYLSRFTEETRVVILQGEAYFDVMKDVEHPFQVVSSDIVTTALGTSFNVNAFEESEIRVSLNTGKVDVNRKGTNERVILLPGEQANAYIEGIDVVQFDKNGVLAWKDGTIYFKNTSLNEMILVLEKWYDVSVRTENLSEIRRKELNGTGKFTHQPLSNVLELLSHSMSFQFRIEEKNVILIFQ